jgi:amino acid adenylation domain-containing protein
MIIDEFGLSPIQEGMLFHHLSGDAPGVDIEQIVIGYDEPVDAVLLERAWQLTVERHPALRASFEWKQSSDPVQRVHDRVDLRLEVQADGEDETGFQEFLARDRAFGFDLSQAPLMRLTLFDYGKHRYRLVWTVHHILLDGRAFILVLNDVEEFYQRLRRGETVVAEPGPAFRPYIEWLQSLDLKDASQFWADRLRGLAGPTPLLEDAQAPGGAFRGYGEEELRLSEKTTLALREAAKRYDITLNTIVMGVWGLLLGRYSGEQDVLFGATKTTRRGSIAGADAVAGLFLNTIPVRANLPPETTIAAMLQELRAQWLGLRTYEHTPLTRIKEASGFTPSAALFDSLVVFENQSFLTALRATSACWEKREWHLLEQNNFPLTFAVYGDPEMLLRLEFDRRKFTYETAQRMLRHARQLFEGIAANPEQKIAELTLLTPAEREQLLVEWNYTKQEYPRRCVHEMFEEQVESTPDSVALVFENQCLTYRELNARANRLANYLRRLGVGPEDLVALYAERSLDMVVGLIGILKAGGAYLPIDTVYPKDRIGFMLEDAKVGVLVTQESLLASLGEPQARVVCLDTEWKTIEQESPENLSLNVGPDNLAYVIYTSGSTGKPKGCLMTHYNVARLMEATDPWFHFGESDVWTLFHSHAFDFSVWEIWGALLYGGRLVVVPYWVSRDPGLFLQLLRNQRVTVLNQTPSAFRQLIQADEAAGGTDLSLRVVIFGGEALELQSLRPWFDRHGDQRPQLVNMYGITETTVHVTHRPLSLEDVLEGCGSVIGRPIPDLRLYILDPQRQPTPIGVPGEIYVGGAGVARGYLHRPELTKERFIDNPFSTQSGDRLYRSGDLARRLANGDIEYLGRIDLQVKIRGFRIELGEIEAALRQHPEVREAVVVLDEREKDKRLVGYIVPGSSTPSTAELRAFLGEKLPDYMLPSVFVVLNAVPLTANGKLDRKALPAPKTDAYATGGYEPPQGEIETKLAAIWAEVLKLDRVGRYDNFFEMGGDSLRAYRLFVKIVAAFPECQPSLAVLMKAPTVEQFACSLRGGQADWSCLVAVREGNERPPFFCVPGAGGNVLSLRDLAMALPPDQPFYCLQARGLDGHSAPFSSVEETAGYYIEQIRRVQSHGPYYLGGGCYGGLVAFEMARSLRSQRETVNLVALIDTTNFSYGRFLSKQKLIYVNSRFFLESVINFIPLFAFA